MLIIWGRGAPQVPSVLWLKIKGSKTRNGVKKEVQSVLAWFPPVHRGPEVYEAEKGSKSRFKSLFTGWGAASKVPFNV